MSKKPRILVLDIETAPIEAYTWGLFDQNPGLPMMKADWTVLSWSAKWLGEPAIFYKDVSEQKNKRDDSKILKGIWALLDACDIVLTQNGKAFDIKKLNARFCIHGMKPPSPYKHIDTRQMAKRTFGFTSNSLEYLGNALGVQHKKLKHKKFPGFELWRACLSGVPEAWAEMKAYNKQDILALEDIYNRLAPWHNPVDFSPYVKGAAHVCPCGEGKLQRRGFDVTSTGRFQRYQCLSCGAWSRDKKNVMPKAKRQALRKGI